MAPHGKVSLRVSRGIASCLACLQLAERTITDDLEFLIAHTVDKRKADYAGRLLELC